jgi:hypothetical protein
MTGESPVFVYVWRNKTGQLFVVEVIGVAEAQAMRATQAQARRDSYQYRHH